MITQGTKRVPDALAVAWLNASEERQLFLSVISLLEIRIVVSMLGKSRRRTAISEWLGETLPNRFRNRILPVTPEIANNCGSLIADCRLSGFDVEPVDALIAATARIYGMSIVTLNYKHFTRLNVSVVRF